MNDRIASSVYILLWLMLVASALATRRLPRGKLLSLGGIWLAIILALWGLVVVMQKLL